MEINDLTPSKDLYLKVRAGFVAQGTTLNAWCRANGHLRGNARHALIGSWDGPKGRAFRADLVKAAGLAEAVRAAA